MKSTKLAQQKCLPCEEMEKALSAAEAKQLIKKTPEWKIDVRAKSIKREWNTKNFVAAVDFINQIKKVAEAENHHPDIHLENYRKLRVELSTHAIKGLSKNDFILAGKIDQLPVKLKK